MKPACKQSYHPFILLSFCLNILPEDLLEKIPYSTKYDWKQKPLHSAFGYDWYCSNAHLLTTLQHIAVNKRLLQINKALIRIIAVQRFMQRYKAHIDSKLYNAAGTVVSNIQKVQQVIGGPLTLKLLNINNHFYYTLRQKARCKRSLLNLCVIKHPTQLLQKEISLIKKYGTDDRYTHWPLVSVYHQIIRDGMARFHISTFYKYAALLDLKRIKTFHRRKNHHTGIRAAAPLQLLHADITVFKTMDNVKAYIYIIQDNFSRAILGYKVSLEKKAAIMKEALEEVYEKYLKPSSVFHCSFMTDDGSENYGAVQDFIKAASHPFLEHIVAQQTVEYSNSMVEAVHKNLKYRFLYHKHIPDIASLIKYLIQAVSDYNNRPHAVLNGLTPLEVLDGKSFDKKLLQQQVIVAKTERIAANKQEKCCYFSF